MNTIEKFLGEIAEVMEVLNRFNSNPRVNPKIFILTSFIMVSLVAFSKTLISTILALVYMVSTLIILRLSFKVVFKVMALAFLFSILPAVPLIFSKTGYVSNLNDISLTLTYSGLIAFITFVLRVTVSTGLFTTPIAYLGWSYIFTVFESKGGLSDPVSVFKIFVTSIPKTLRYMLSLLMAREARVFRKNLRSLWYMLSAIVGDILIASNGFSRELMLSISARSFGRFKVPHRSYNIGALDYLVMLATLVYVTIYVMVEFVGYS